MLYSAYQAQSQLLAPVRALAAEAGSLLDCWAGDLYQGRSLAAACKLVAGARLTHSRPAFEIDKTRVGEREVNVVEEAAATTPFATLLHFRKEMAPTQPRVLLAAPLSGHFATLLRNTVETLLPEHDVYITDWKNARDVGLRHGRFGFDDYVEHIIRFLEAIGPGAHVVAVCQPCVQGLVAAAVMADAGNAATPRSITLMAGPIDARINPTTVNELAASHPIEWFERKLITLVPLGLAGAMRRVYPGFLQLAAFMGMNLDRHLEAHFRLYNSLVRCDGETAAKTKGFYDEYFAVLDLPAEFYLETVEKVFQRHDFALGRLEYRGRRVDPRAIRRTALLTIEGEHDDICAVGQTLAAHDLCSALRPYLKRHYMQAGVGHYGVFSGRRWSHQIYPIVKNLILAME